MQDEMNEMLEEAFVYFKHVHSMSIIRQALKCINPNVRVEYDMELQSILIDDYLSCYIPVAESDTYAINQQVHDPGSYHEPPSYDERLLGEYGSALEQKFYEEIVKFYSEEQIRNAKMVIDEALDYHKEQEYLKEITG